MLSQGTSNALAELRGEVPADVAAQVQRTSAFRSLMGGFSGTGMSRALSARDFGLTSLNMTEMGKNSAQVWTDIAEKAFSPWTISTSEQAAATAANNAGEQATKQFKLNVEAAPDPGAAGVFNVDAALGQQWMSFGMASMGGGAGGGGGATAAVAGQQPAIPGYQYNPGTGQYVQVSGAAPDWRTNATSGAWSDRRLKENIIKVGVSPSGINIYEFNYIGADPSIRYRGAMAQELIYTHPDAVGETDDGYLCVDYGQLDVRFDRAPQLEFAKVA